MIMDEKVPIRRRRDAGATRIDSAAPRDPPISRIASSISSP
jgi:hypothetical protein